MEKSMNDFTCPCKKKCPDYSFKMPSGMELHVPQCLFIEGIFQSKKVMESLKKFDLHLLEQAIIEAQQKLRNAKEFWEKASEKFVEESNSPKEGNE